MTILGRIVAGSLSDGLEARLDAATSVEDMAVGRYVVVDGEKRRFFGMVTDVLLDASSKGLLQSPPDVSDPFVAEVLAGTATFGKLELQPMLTIADGLGDDGKPAGPQPVKTIPTHYSPVREATADDVSAVFGEEDERHFYIGQPIDMDTHICLDLKRLVERSTGVFGKSGTGKTFLTRLLLVGITQKNVAVNLVFDMHNEYGWSGNSEGHGHEVKALKQLFPARVAIFTLDRESSRARGVSADFDVEIGYDQIEVADFELLREALDMHPAQIETIERLGKIFGERQWIDRFLDIAPQEFEELAKTHGLHPNTLNVIRRKLETRIIKLPFVKRQANDDSVKRILEHLQMGKHVVLEFGRHGSLEAYLLVANILTRRIHERWVELAEQAMGAGLPKPRPLVITIEEAHKFLSPAVAEYTIFGKIAREMRKYSVTLLVVDQRPSGIADEVMSQIGTRVTCLLDDEKDTAAVLSGIPGGQALKSVLSRLDTKQQAMILGHAVPMPAVIRTREYGSPESYKELTSGVTSLPPVLAGSRPAGDPAPNGGSAKPAKPAIDILEDLFK
jgi:uncharacterized protein